MEREQKGRNITFPRTVWRVRIRVRKGEWEIIKTVEIPEMTLPPSAELPRETKERGLTGFWVNLLNESGETLYRVTTQNPLNRTAEIFEADGSITRNNEKAMDECVFEVLVPDVPGMAALEVFSSTTEDGKRHSKARELTRIPLRTTPGEGGEYGRR